MVEALADAMTDSDRDRAQSFVVFRLGGEGYALEVMRVQEVLDVQSMTEVPGSPKCLLGVINLRGHVVLEIHLAGSMAYVVDAAPADGTERRAAA